MKDSLFRRALRSFFSAFSAVIGIFVGFFFILVVLILLYSDEHKLSTSVKIKPDADGNRKELSSSAPVILEVHIDGEIGKEEITGEKIQEILLRSREKEFAKDRVKAILLVINSPGGSVNDSNIIYNALLQYKERYKVPIYAYVDGLCASGGYYISCAADKIYASEVSIIGSIGVLSWPPYFNVKETLEKLGIDTMTLTAGKGKDDLNPFRSWKPGEQTSKQDILDFFYHQFVAIVAKARPRLSVEKLHELGAKVFDGVLACEYGYIDEKDATRDQALKDLVSKAEIQGKYQVVMLQKKSWWKRAVEEKSPLFSGKIQHELTLPYQKEFPFSYIFKP